MRVLIHTLHSSQRPVGADHIREFWLGIEDLGHIERVRNRLHAPTLKTAECL